MTDYKATPEQWRLCHDYEGPAWQDVAPMLLELRARVEALEAQTQQPCLHRGRHGLAAMAEGAGVGVSDEEMTALVRVFQAAYNAKRTELRALPNPYRHDTESDMADHAGLRAVLARYGTHPRPIPLPQQEGADG
jgi:hypothetical protein